MMLNPTRFNISSCVNEHQFGFGIMSCVTAAARAPIDGITALGLSRFPLRSAVCAGIQLEYSQLM